MTIYCAFLSWLLDKLDAYPRLFRAVVIIAERTTPSNY
jgi:hypothetical protein